MANALDILIKITQQMSGDDAIGKLRALDRQIQTEEKSLANLERQMAKMQAGPSVNIKQFEALSGKIAASKEKLGELTQAFGEAGGKSALMKEEILSMLGGIGGIVGGVVTAVLAIAAAFAAVTIAIGYAALKLSEFALQAAGAHRALVLMQGALSGSKAAGDANVEAIERVARSTALAKEQVEQIGKRLTIAGLSGKLYEQTLRTIAQASALMGEQAGAHLESILERSKALGHFQLSDRGLRGLGISFADVAKAAGTTEAAFKAAMKGSKVSVEDGMMAINKAMAGKLGGSSAAMMLDFNVQIMKLHENIAALFKDIKIEGFLKALQSLLSIFDQETAAGKLMHAVITRVFDEVFAGAAKALPYVKEFMIGILIQALRLYLALRQLKNAIKEALGEHDDLVTMTRALEAGKVAVNLFVAALVVLTVIFAPLIAAIAQTYEMMKLAWAVFDEGVDFAERLYAALSGITFPDLGGLAANMIGGLLDGIDLGAVAAKMAQVGATAKDALANALGIHSDSTVMKELGGHTAGGFVTGVDDGAPEAHEATANLAKVPERGKASGAAGAGNGGPSFSWSNCTFGSVSREQIESWITDFVEGSANEAGVATDPEPA